MDQHTNHTFDSMQSPAPKSLVPKIDRLVLQVCHKIDAYPRLASSIEFLCRLLRFSNWMICFYHVQGKVHDQATTTFEDSNRIQLERIYFIVNRAIFIKTEAAATITEEIHRNLCICHCFFQFVAVQGGTASGDNSIVVNALSHISDQTPKERMHITFKICTLSMDDVEDHSGHFRRWWCKVRGGRNLVFRSSATYHLYTDRGYCDGQYRKSKPSTKSKNMRSENGCARRLKRARCRGTLVWDGQKHQFEWEIVGGAGAIDTCEMKCASLDAFVEVTESDEYV